MDSKPTYAESISNAFTSRVGNLEASREQRTEEAEAARPGKSVDTPLDDTQKQVVGPDTQVHVDDLDDEDEGDGKGEDEDVPAMSWKKGEIVDAVAEANPDADRADLEAMTKAELLDRFVG